MPSIYVEKSVEVQVDLKDFSDGDLIEELECRNISIDYPEDTKEILEKIWMLRRSGQPYDHLMDDFLYRALGVLI